MEKQEIELLLVEDSEEDIELTLHALRIKNLANSVRVARDGEEALQLVAELQQEHSSNSSGMPRLILLDLKLPKLDGLEVLRQLKSDPQTASIPVVILTSSREYTDVETAYALGVNSYLVKPVNFAKFSDAVGQIGLYWLMLNEVPTHI